MPLHSYLSQHIEQQGIITMVSDEFDAPLGLQYAILMDVQQFMNGIVNEALLHQKH